MRNGAVYTPRFNITLKHIMSEHSLTCSDAKVGQKNTPVKSCKPCLTLS